MKSKRLALRVSLHSALMILGVYLVLQIVNYFRDNMIFGITDLSQLLASVWGFVGSTVLPPTIIFTVLIYFLALPIQRVQRKLEAGEILEPGVLEKTRRRLLAFSFYILTINLIGFALGYVLSLFLQNRMTDLLKIEGIVIMSSNISGGFVYASAQTALNNLAFADLRDSLGIREIGSRRREMRSSTRQIFLSAFLLYYAGSFLQYQTHDFNMAQSVESAITRRIQSGELKREDAGNAYRTLLLENLPLFSTRKNLDPSIIPLPWERPRLFVDVQQQAFIMIFTFIFLIGTGIQIVSSAEMREQINTLMRRIRDVVAGGGDLRRRLTLRNMDDLGELTGLINQLLDQFHGVVSRIGTAVEQTHHGASAIDNELEKAELVSRKTGDAVLALKADLENQAAESRKLSSLIESFRKNLTAVDQAAEVQNSFVSETSAAMEEMASNIQSVETITGKSGKLTENLSQQGMAGGTAVQETSAAIAEIDDAAQKVLEVLGSLNKIAASINLLAMNAAIEAAHAGTQGLGFAVVADEVRKLASIASSQTKNIKTLISAMGERVKRGVERSNSSGKMLASLVEGLDDAASLSREIADAMKEQTAGTRSVANSLVQAVDSSKSIRTKMAEQTVQTDQMSSSLNEAFKRLEALAENSHTQTESVKALEASFIAVRVEVDKNLKAVETLTTEVGRFKL